MRNWRNIFSWQFSYTGLDIGDRVEVIATEELLHGIGIIAGAEETIGSKGVVLNIDLEGEWSDSVECGKGSCGVQFSKHTWEFPLTNWQDYLRKI